MELYYSASIEKERDYLSSSPSHKEMTRRYIETVSVPRRYKGPESTTGKE